MRLPVITCVAMAMLAGPATAHEGTVLQAIAASRNHKTLLSALVLTGLDDALKSGDKFTIFAPTDDAFARLPEGTLDELLKPENRDQLRDILKLHVTTTRITTGSFQNDGSTVKSLAGQPLELTSKGQRSFVNGITLTGGFSARNGQVLPITNVLLPKSSASEYKPGGLLATANNAGKFKTLLKAVEAAGLAEGLENDSAVTLFAPTDEAFAKIPEATLKKLLRPENKAELRSLLLNHVVKGRRTSTQLLQEGGAVPLQNSGYSIRLVDGQLRVKNARVIINDVKAGDGIIHVIDTVLMP